MYCSKCGTELKDEWQLCPVCGAKIIKEVSVDNADVVSEKGVLQPGSKKGKKKKLGVVVGLILLAACIIAGSVFAVISTNKKKEREQMLSLAESYFKSGNYEAALDAYGRIDDPSIASEYIDACYYGLAEEAIDKEEWEKALEYLAMISAEDYKDNQSLVRTCEEEIERASKADAAFLADLERSVKSRLYASDGTSWATLVKTELGILKDYKNKDFYDKELKRLATQYIHGVETQEKALKHEKKNQLSFDWYSGKALREQALSSLYSEYGFMNDNDDFYQQYVIQLQQDQAFVNVIKSTNSDILKQLNKLESFINEGMYSCSATLTNNTSHTISVIFYFKLYTSDESRYLETVSYYAEKIPPKASYKIYVNSTELKNRCMIETDWEVTDFS